MATSDNLQPLEDAHHLAADISADHSEEVPDLFVCVDECYIYAKDGDDKGFPNNDADILYDTVPDEILQLNTENRKGKYVRCELPVEGWVYLPEEDAQYDWTPLDEIYDRKKRIAEKLKKEQESDDSDDDNNITDDGASNHLTAIEENEDVKYNENDEHDWTLIEEDRRDYTKQRMMAQTKPPELNDEINKLMQIKFLRWLTFYFRKYPFLPGLIIIVIKAVIECIILFDVYSDVSLAMELRNSDNRWIFAVSMSFIFAPYIIAWTAAAQMGARKLQQHPGNIFYIIAVLLYDIAPLGIIFLFLVDIYHWFECVVIIPIYYIFTGGKQIRMISYEELGYYKLRRVSEIFAEAMPQAVIQLLLLISAGGDEGVCSKCTTISIVMALCSSLFVLGLWCTIIFLEGKANGMGFVEYMTVIMQGSINFVPLLPAIERGTNTGKKVNWTYYKLSSEGVGHVAKAIQGPTCKLKTLKISSYSIKALDRFGCRYFGGALASKIGADKKKRNIELIVSRLEEEVADLFKKYDVDGSKSLDFEEFVHLCLIIKKNMKEPLLRSDVFLIYEELADSVKHEVWQLDLIIKIRGSKERIGLLDYDLPLQHAYETGDLRMMSLLTAYGYETQSDDNLGEFEYCVSNAITSGKIREALCLSEVRGVPIVVRVESGDGLLPMDDDGKSDPYVRVQIFDQVQITQYRKQTLTPVWNEDLLFIVPFEFMDRLLHAKEMQEKDNKSMANLRATMGSVEDIGNVGGVGGFGDRGQSFAAIDVTNSVVTGLSMPKYAQTAITNDLKSFYNKDFAFHTAGSEADIDKVMDSAPNLMKRNTTDPTADEHKFGGTNTEREAHAPKIHFGNQSSKLSIRFRVFDHDADDEDDYMGAFKKRINMSDDTADYHKTQQKAKLQYLHGDKNQFNAGTISYRIFLNAVQVYQKYDTHYIDMDTKEDEAELFDAEINDVNAPQMRDVWQM